MGNICIQITDLRKTYKNASTETLKGIDLSIEEGEKIGILGPNGAGKTTLISIICGLIPASSGNIIFSNIPSENERELKQKIGFVPQDYAFYSELSPLQNLEYFGALYNLNRLEIKQKSAEILEILGLLDVKDKKISTFSGGMKRRVNLAIGILHNPQILFLDEPTVGVDVQSKFSILAFLNDLNKKGTTIIYTSHHLSEAQEFCNHIALIDHGKILLDGPTDELLVKHSAKDLQDLFISLTGAGYRDGK